MQKNMARGPAEESGCMAEPVPETDTLQSRGRAAKRG